MEYNYHVFKQNVYKLININLDLYKERQMKRRIDSFIEKKMGKLTYEFFYKNIAADISLRQEFVNYLTINVSEFYRNPDQWNMFEKDILPNIIKNAGPIINIWSAACSTGDEPYTLAMILLKYLPASRFKILATDIDDKAIEMAKMGKYPDRSLSGLPKDYISKYFVAEGSNYIISDDIKKLVTFKKHNLLEDKYPTNIDLIVCRNVVIYFTDEAKVRVYKDFNKTLKKNGMLFIGNTEQIIRPTELGFNILKSFFYQKAK